MIVLKFPGIKGSTNAGDCKECILLNSIDFAIGRRGSQTEKQSNSNRKLGMKFCDPILISRQCDNDTRQLMNQSLLCTTSKAIIYQLETANRVAIQIELSDCIINDIKISWHGNICTESFYLTFTEINYRTIPLPSEGMPGGAGFNLLTGEGA